MAADLKLNRAKCVFIAPSVEYLGHVIDKNGLHPTQEKVKAIEEAHFPTSVTELRAFFGLLNYYSNFLPNLASKLSPLYKLLCKTTSGHGGGHRGMPLLRPKDYFRVTVCWFILMRINH